jgi:hypothetical protein
VVDHDGNLRATFFHCANDLASVWGRPVGSLPKFALPTLREIPSTAMPGAPDRQPAYGRSQHTLLPSVGRIPMAQSISSHSRCRRRPELRARSALRKAAKLSTGSDFCTELIHRTSRSIALTEAGRDFTSLPCAFSTTLKTRLRESVEAKLNRKASFV